MNENETKKLSRTDLFSMAIGQIIGVGIMTMTGIAIGFTGRSVNLAYIVAGLITIFAAIPQIYIGGTANFYGGQYSQIGVLCGQKAAGIFLYIQLFTSLAISMYTLSFADYFLSLFPNVNAKLISFIVLTALFGMHFFGVKQAARLQNILCAILAIAIAAYIVLGIGNVQGDYLTNGFMTKGIGGFVLASIYLTFAAGVVSLKRLLNQSNLKSWSSKMIKKSLEAYFFTLKNKIVFCKKQFQNMSVFCFVSTEIA